MATSIARGATYTNDSLGSLVVLAVTNGSGAPYAAQPNQSGIVFDNEGTGAKSYINLPPTVKGLTFTFMVQNTNGLRFIAPNGSTIRNSTSVTVSGGFAEATAIGATMRLVAINSTQWISTSTQGSWSLT